MVQQVVWQGPHFPWLCVIMSSSQSGVYSSHIHSVTYCCFLGVFQEMTLMKTSLLWISLGECGEACSLMLLKPMELVISAVMASERCIPCHRCYLHRQSGPESGPEEGFSITLSAARLPQVRAEACISLQASWEWSKVWTVRTIFGELNVQLRNES